MKAIAKLSALRSIVCALIALALLASPVQFSAPVQASAGAAMSDMNCPSKKSCCDMDKNDCAKERGCLAKCGGAPSMAFLERAASQLASDGGVYFSVPHSLIAHISTPLRRPPRI